jgi:hypothetical protein
VVGLHALAFVSFSFLVFSLSLCSVGNSHPSAPAMYISLVSKNIVLAALAILVAVLALNTITVQNRQVTVTVNPNDFVPSDASRYEVWSWALGWFFLFFFFCQFGSRGYPVVTLSV